MIYKRIPESTATATIFSDDFEAYADNSKVIFREQHIIGEKTYAEDMDTKQLFVLRYMIIRAEYNDVRHSRILYLLLYTSR